MAIINTLRKRMGNIVVIVVAFSMVAFILTDFLQSNSSLFGNSRDVGEINGKEISYERFQAELDKMVINYQLNMGRSPLAEEMDELRKEAWQNLILDHVFGPQFEELGIVVTKEELVDMVQGNNIDPQIRQFFTDPNTGQFDKENVVQFLRSLTSPQAPPQQVQAWRSFEAGMGPRRQLTKYENLLEMTRFANKYEAQREYSKTASRNVSYFYVPFFSISDSLAKVTDKELEDYISKNAEEYKRDWSKSIDYVSFKIAPSAEDSSDVLFEINKLKEGLVSAEDDSVFATINSDGISAFTTYAPNNLPEWLTNLENPTVGYVSEPQLLEGKYSLFKITSIFEGEEAYVKANHILFKSEDDSQPSKEKAKAEARRVLKDIKSGASFSEMAQQYGTDGTASRGGDLGWFGENSSFVQEFKDAAFSFRGKGLLPDVVETEFGYHIIEITEEKTKKSYKVAQIEKELFPSDATTNEIYRQADDFAASISSLDDFKAKSNEMSLKVQSANRLTQNDKRVGTMENARSLVFWLFNTAEIGDVSEVFEIGDQYVVAIQKDEQDEGTAKLDEIRAEVSRKVMDKKKFEYVTKKLEGKSGSVEDMKNAYGDGARTGVADLTLSSNSFPGVGFAPEAIGLAFSMEQGETTRPFSIQNGVLILMLNSAADQADITDYEAYRSLALNSSRSFKRRETPITYQNIYNALLEKSEIEDTRYRFY